MQSDAARPSLLRVLAAVFYDLWLLAALWLLGGMVDYLLSKALTGDPASAFPLALQAWLLLSPLLYLGWFWTHGGQTTGMRAWRIRVLTTAGRPLRLKHAILRYLAAFASWGFAGLGFVWILFDRNRRSWHDHLSGTRLVMLKKRP